MTSPEWFAWYDQLLAARLAACPRERAATYYFSQAGDDLAGDGTIGNPWRSLAKAAQILAANPQGNLALLFRRGDVWREQVGIDSTAPNVTIADYGTGAKPLFTPFVPFEPREGWTKATGMKSTWWRTAPRTVTWAKESNNFDKPYAAQSSIGNVEASEGSWFYDWLSQRLYVHPWHERVTAPPQDGLPGYNSAEGPRHPNSLPIEYVLPTDAGFIVRGHGSRIENIATIGWGMQESVPSQQHGIEARCTGADEVVVVRCDSHYGSSHAMTHLAAGAMGGIATFVECTAGLTTFNNAGETIFNAFSYQGDQEIIFHRCTATQGTLPSYRWPSYSNPEASRRGVGFYGHTGGEAVGLFKLFVSYGCTIRSGPVGFQAPSNIGDLPAVTAVDNVHAFFVGESFEGGPGSGANFPIAPTNSVRINGVYRARPARGSSLASWAQEGWIINSTFELDLANQNGLFAAYNGLAGALSRPRIWNSAFHLATTNANTTFQLDYDTPSQSAGSTMVNTIFSKTGPGQSLPNLGAVPGTLRSNAYFGIAPAAYSSDPSPIVLTQTVPPGARPTCGSPLACTAAPLPDGVTLAFDQSRFETERRSVGPLESLRCSDFNEDGQVDFFDYLDFVSAFADGLPDADINRDGQVDFFDYLDFVATFDREC